MNRTAENTHIYWAAFQDGYKTASSGGQKIPPPQYAQPDVASAWRAGFESDNIFPGVKKESYDDNRIKKT